MSQPQESKQRVKTLDIVLVRRILSYVKPFKALAVGGVLLALGIAAVRPIPTLLQRRAIDEYLVPYVQNPNLDPNELMKGLFLVMAGYLSLRVLEFLLNYTSVVTIGYLGQNVLRNIRADLFSKLQRLQLRYFDQNPVGRLITRVTSDVDSINQFISGGLVSMITSSFLIVVYITVMLSINWQLALISFAVLPILFVATKFFGGKIRNANSEVRNQSAIVNSKLNENITGMLTVQLFGRNRRSNLDFDHSNRDLLDANATAIHWFAMFMPTVAFLSKISEALVLYFAARMILGADAVGTGVEAIVTVGTLFAFSQWIQQLFQPIQDLADVFNNLQAAMVGSERIFAVLDTPEEIQDKPNAKYLKNFAGEVKFEDVHFAYDSEVTADTPDKDERWILRGLNLHIKPGESVALVGATGAGKTSVTALVSRFYDVQRGSVQVDGHDVRDLAQHDLRRHIGVVLQDVFLFAGTIESNLTLGNKKIAHERVIEACQYVGIHEYIMGLEHGYQTEVRERGATLSTGQKQLLAFARALIQNPDILLVLDEATASVDTETEMRIQSALQKVMKGRTSIIVAHRMSTIEHCDRIIVMRKGQIVEQGAHSDLLAKGGYYSKLHRLQYAKGEAAD